MNLNIGELNKKIKFINYTILTNENDEIERVENIYHNCWAKVSNTSGIEIIKSGSDFSEVKTRFLIIYTPKSINSSLEIEFNGNKYNIDYVNDYGFSHEFIEIFATLKTPISYVFDIPAKLLWTEYINDVLTEKHIDLLVSQEALTREAFYTDYQNGMDETHIYKINMSDWILTSHNDIDTDAKLYATVLVDGNNNKYNIKRIYREKNSNVIELICTGV